MDVFATTESEVRSYCRSWPAVFATASGSWLHDEDGRPYLDFFAGAGALNYGHNNPALKSPLMEHLAADGITHGLDMRTVAKREFLEIFRDVVLVPRGLDHRVQFTGSTGVNSVEAALKLARKVTGRDTVASFVRGFHGMSLGALAVTDRDRAARVPSALLGQTVRLPYDRGRGPVDLGLVAWQLDHAGADLPAAVIVETVQCEGGVSSARPEWLRGLARMCRERSVLLIADEVQTGCGRTGSFFGFEESGIVPDIICVSKSISGFGLPMALTLLRPALDVWEPGEHNGTFRGNNAAFVTAAAALRTYWTDDEFELGTQDKGELVASALARTAAEHGLLTRGRGLVHALVLPRAQQAAAVRQAAFERGLLVETSGRDESVLKLLPPLTASEGELERGLAVLHESVQACVRPSDRRTSAVEHTAGRR
ncbi:diaminobutyrate--2-oxoglutarate transaminase [Lentzea sp. NPDC060358]|uniref:diaminobutyrate--2-oxoglutarate transaminase n=1 Tax=Lentzea sp. NPDC060358 TaxID=3347103 RepID=UPI0036644A44